MLAYVLSDIFLFLEKIICIVSSRFKKKNVMSRTGLESKPKPTTLFWVWFGLDFTNYMDPNSSINKIP